MGTISKRKEKHTLLPASSQLRYAAIYILITAVALMSLNIYAPRAIRSLIFRSQHAAMEDKAQLMISAFSGYEKLDSLIARQTIESVNDLHATRIIVTDPSGYCLYDSLEQVHDSERMILLPEVVEALSGNDVFYISLSGSALKSRVAMPIMAYNKLIGSVYLMDYDTDLGTLISSLEQNLLRISVALEAVVILFSLVFSTVFSRRMRRISDSIRQMRDGNYEAKIRIRGHDDVAKLGAAFNELADRLKQSEDVRKQFVSNASHELKTPLASIKLLSDSILQNDMDPATVQEFVTDIGNEADRLTRLSQKLLELTRLDSTEEEEQELADVAAVVERVLRMLAPLAESHLVQLSQSCQPGCTVLTMEDDLYQILFNLSENGIKYNSSPGSLSVSAVRDEENVTIRVEDTGVGIPEEAKTHIFERFYRVDKARSRRGGGAGIGLSIVHDMVRRNGGTIAVSDREGGGTCFTVVFPYFNLEEDGA